MRVIVWVSILGGALCLAPEARSAESLGRADLEALRAARDEGLLGASQAGLTLHEAQALAESSGPEQIRTLTAALQRVADQLAGHRKRPYISRAVAQAFLATLNTKRIARVDWPLQLDELTQQYLKLGARLAAVQVRSGPVRRRIRRAEAALRQGRLAAADTLLGEAASLAVEDVRQHPKIPNENNTAEEAARLLAAAAAAAFTQLDWPRGAGLLEQAYAQLADAPSDDALKWLLEAGDAWIAAGSADEALRVFTQAVDAASMWGAADPSSAQRQRTLAVSHSRLAQIQFSLSPASGEESGLENYQASLAIADKLAAPDPSSTQALREALSTEYRMAGSKSDPIEAVKSEQALLEKVSRLAVADPANAQWQRYLFVTQASMGKNLSWQGDLAGAVRSYQDALGVGQQLVAADATREPWWRVRLELTEVLGTYRDALELSAKLRGADSAANPPHNPVDNTWRHSLCNTMTSVAQVLQAQGDRSSAYEMYAQCLPMLEQVADAEPSNTGEQRELAALDEKIGDYLLARQALPFYEESTAIRQRLAAADPSDIQTQHELATSEGKLGETQWLQGDPSAALQSDQASVAINKAIAAADPSSSPAQLDLAGSQSMLGDALMRSDQAVAALPCYQAALVIWQKEARAHRSLRDWSRVLSLAHEQLGDVLRTQGAIAEALRHYRAALSLRRTRTTAGSSKAREQHDIWSDAQHDIWLDEKRIGDTLRARGELTAAIKSYQAIRHRAHSTAADAADTPWQADLAASDESIGDALGAQGALEAALQRYRASVTTFRSLAAAEPDDRWQSGLVAILNKMGDIFTEQGDLAEALKSYQASLEISARQLDNAAQVLSAQAAQTTLARMAAAASSNWELQRTLAAHADRIGDALSRGALPVRALDLYREALVIRQRIAAAFPSDLTAQHDPTVSEVKIAEALMAIGGRSSRQKDWSDALEHYQAALDILQKAVAEAPEYDTAQVQLKQVQFDIDQARLQAAGH